MKTFFAISAFLFAGSVWAASPMAVGTYQGTGQMLSANGVVTDFTLTSVVTQDDLIGEVTLTDTYQVGTNPAQSYVYKVLHREGVLTVRRDGVVAGTGYCIATLCHLTYNFADTKVSGEETFFVNGNHVERLGSRQTDGGPIRYVRTSLDKVN